MWRTRNYGVVEDPKGVEAARRQLQSLRDEYQAQLRLLQLELDDAKLAFESAAKEHKRATQLEQQNIISSSELDRQKIAEGQARLRLQQLETLYELYRKVGQPAKEAPGVTDTAGGPSPADRKPTSRRCCWRCTSIMSCTSVFPRR